MIDSCRAWLIGYRHNLFSKDHWFAELWGGSVLMIFPILAHYGPSKPEAEWPPDLGFTHVLPDHMWQTLMLIVGLLQIISLGTKSLLFRGTCAFIAGWLACWATLNIYIYGAGVHPGIALGTGWVGINMFAVSRCVAGLR
ncbi:hypothetical protein [Entomobacter blattae]|uniref:Uncharacterized protein n=1 Tax=Entomobacter blattae TaxID=2762277 RepID=A0A7H1NTR2_9PROT|nr:hypothetical protein [Entomobacter blattae]QNT79172.1 hypothetical protein JGUZn3_19670 [Entomobacter blattae]QNT79461.1 hypothetical protein JGUZn3_22600 [Entomobacter blattae]